MEIRRHENQLDADSSSCIAPRRMPTGASVARRPRSPSVLQPGGFDIANEALQVMGGLGYTRKLVEYCLRRCLGWMIAGDRSRSSRTECGGVFERSFSHVRLMRDGLRAPRDP